MRHYRREFYVGSELLREMLSLYLEGWNEYMLAEKYEKDRTTILYWIKKTGTYKRNNSFTKVTRIIVPKPIVQEPIRHKYAHLLEEPINSGKNYKEYLSRKRSKDEIKELLSRYTSDRRE